MIERHFDIPFISRLALSEKQIQQNYRPVIAVHKWFARRPGTLFRGLTLAEFVGGVLSESFYASHDLPHVRVCDPFMGGGTPLLEANRVGCDVIGYDINPMACWVVRQELADLDVDAYLEEAARLRAQLEEAVGSLYRTRCLVCGAPDAHVKYFLWVKLTPCSSCREDIPLFPGYLVARDRRHPRNVFVCPDCGRLLEDESLRHPTDCPDCGASIAVKGTAARNRATCPACGEVTRYPSVETGAPRHRLFAMEYFCPQCRPDHQGRFFKSPDEQDHANVDAAARRWSRTRARFVPEDAIPPGDETDRLHRWGYRHYHEMFNARQLLGLEISCRHIAGVQDERIRHALATNLSDLLRYQNMVCRYDTKALKSLDVFSIHGYPVSLVQCESNLLGIPLGRGGACVGSGGWANIIDKYAKAKNYCRRPFEVRFRGTRKTTVPISGEHIGDRPGAGSNHPRSVEIHCATSTDAALPPASLDAVLTDPPYFGNVQYAELMDFCYVWLRKLVGTDFDDFAKASTRDDLELTGNVSMGRGLGHYAQGLSDTFRRMADALKPGAPLAFTFHHNRIEPYCAVAVAILDATLVCSGSIPCPAEMGGSIHISGTGSSIVDTVFVCRSTGTVPAHWLAPDADAAAELVAEDARALATERYVPSDGDLRCITFGHVTRLAVWHLRDDWHRSAPIYGRLATVQQWIKQRFPPDGVLALAQDAVRQTVPAGGFMVMEEAPKYEHPHEVSF